MSNEKKSERRRVAVVTGGSAGLGRAIVREFAERGWDVAILARGREGLDGAVRDVERIGPRAIGIETDVADRKAVEAAADQVERELGEIDVWVNDAMVGVFGEFLDTDPDDFERAVSVDFLGFVNGTRAALSRMKPRNRGGVVQVGSALGHRGIPLQAAYCSSKHAIKGFTESVLTELLHDGSAVTLSEVDMPAMNTVQFNWVKSSLPKHAQPVPPIYQPEICAKVVVDVAERPRRRTWVGESTVFTIIGNRLGTRVADWYLAKSGYSGQQDGDPGLPTLRPNLYEPSNQGDQGAHGAFDDRSMRITPQTWAIRHRSTTYFAAAAAAATAAAATAGALRRATR
ncbi:MAG: SDR family oxidoreductase [Acidobacteria bacterium]|nr:SDR family oxidoreductase [Acidobacteriota bacterium]